MFSTLRSSKYNNKNKYFIQKIIVKIFKLGQFFRMIGVKKERIENCILFIFILQIAQLQTFYLFTTVFQYFIEKHLAIYFTVNKFQMLKPTKISHFYKQCFLNSEQIFHCQRIDHRLIHNWAKFRKKSWFEIFTHLYKFLFLILNLFQF